MSKPKLTKSYRAERRRRRKEEEELITEGPDVLSTVGQATGVNNDVFPVDTVAR